MEDAKLREVSLRGSESRGSGNGKNRKRDGEVSQFVAT